LQDLSPQRHLHNITTPVTLMCGENESPEFKRQARDFAQGLSDRGADLTFRWGADLNHFEMLETFAHPKGLMSQYVQALMQG
jgi:arylformamidase